VQLQTLWGLGIGELDWCSRLKQVHAFKAETSLRAALNILAAATTNNNS
jgi:hypothetical protein